MDQIRRKVVEYAVKATTGGQGLDKVLGLVQSAVASGAGSVPDIGKLLAGANLPSLDTDTLMQLVTQAVQSAAPLLAGLRGTAPNPTATGARNRPAPPPVQTSRKSMPSVLGGPRQPAVEVVHPRALAEERAGATKPSSKSTTKAAPKPKATARKATIKAPTFVKAKAAAAPKAKPKAKPKSKPKAAAAPKAKSPAKIKATPRPRAAPKPKAPIKPKAVAKAKPSMKATAKPSPKPAAKPRATRRSLKP